MCPERPDPGDVDGPEPFVITPCAAPHWTQLRQLRLAMLSDDPLFFHASLDEWSAYPDRFWQEWARASQEAHTRLVTFARTAHAPRGMVAGDLRTPSHASAPAYVKVGALWVDPSLRRQGAARSLLTSIESWARQVNASQLRLTVAADNALARRLYATSGYRPTGRTIATARGVDELELAKAVDP